MNSQSHSIAMLPLKANDDSRMGTLLCELGKLEAQDIERVLHLQHERNIRFGEAACSLGLVAEGDIEHALARQFNYSYLPKGHDEFPAELIAAHQPFGQQTEILRSVRAQLAQGWFTKERKTLTIASVNQGDGASFLAANLAVLLAQLGLHTLLLDANLRRPRQHRIFQLSSRQGLSDILAGRGGMELCTKVGAFPHLTVLAAGTVPPNPQELVGGRLFAELHEELRASHDVVLLDVPAFAAGADAFAVSARAGGTVLACRRGHTPLSGISFASDQLRRGGAAVVGSVLLDF